MSKMIRHTLTRHSILHVVELQTKVQRNKDRLSQSPVTFKVTEFQKNKGNNETFYSPSFYISPNGHNMKVKMYANGVGDGEGSHVSVFAYIIKGKYDDGLNWPFVGKVTIKLLEDKDHHSRPLKFTPDNAGGNRGYTEYIPHSELSRDSASNTQYLKDDTLYFRISVEVSDQKPWLECTVCPYELTGKAITYVYYY